MFITGLLKVVLVCPHLGLPEQLLQLLLCQQAMVLDKSGHLGRALRLKVYGPMDLHVAMQSGQERFLSLFGERGRVVSNFWIRNGSRSCSEDFNFENVTFDVSNYYIFIHILQPS